MIIRFTERVAGNSTKDCSKRDWLRSDVWALCPISPSCRCLNHQGRPVRSRAITLAAVAACYAGPIAAGEALFRANTRKIHSGDRESDAIDAAGLAQARERFALLGRDVSQL